MLCHHLPVLLILLFKVPRALYNILNVIRVHEASGGTHHHGAVGEAVAHALGPCRGEQRGSAACHAQHHGGFFGAGVHHGVVHSHGFGVVGVDFAVAFVLGAGGVEVEVHGLFGELVVEVHELRDEELRDLRDKLGRRGGGGENWYVFGM